MSNLQRSDPPNLGGKVIEVKLSDSAFSELKAVAKQRQCSKEDIVRLGISLAKLATEAEQHEQKLVVATLDGEPVKDLVLPK